jgi:surface protein
MLRVVTQLKSLKLLASASLFCGSRISEIELKTLATRFISFVASGVACSALTLSTAFASGDDLVFTTAVDPESRRFKWDYKKDGAAVPVECVPEGEEYVCTVQAGMTINVRNGASQWTDVRQWGNSTLGGQIFALGDDGGLGSLRTITATDAPTLATKINLLFSGQANFDGKGIENWETGSVTDMSQMFVDARNFDGDISKWDVSSVTNFTNMFTRARAFNQDISGWTVSGAVPETNATCFDAGDTAANPNACRKEGIRGHVL